MAKAKKIKVARSPQVQPENFGYPIELRRGRGGFRIVSGCRNFTLSQAETHWQKQRAAKYIECAAPEKVLRNGKCGTCNDFKIRAPKMLKLLPLLAQRAKRYGWTRAK